MKILVDGDSCPVKNIITKVAKHYNVHVVFVASIDHIIDNNELLEVIYVDSDTQAADMEIVNRLEQGDIVATNDYGLASIVIQKKGYCISFSGHFFTEKNIDIYLMKRHVSMKLRKGGYKTKGSKKRRKEDDIRFRENLIKLIEKAK
ncbi:YaiI/YqxD family protein [Caldisalinibacter kiritimatiensis]|uniref:UPF0178 protein L21TH_2075 n=1 Tax=Caldisalinibacter kiritimatiensis TaxID=1304284 RepID=R1CT67_9FIRM|nr:YaiI/YqxD family protein [Caldisalinibacter kiritimatiensis]EOC99888.1 conserved protein YqxD [Caldisalinibacter kiritimatiensis]